MAGWYVGPTGEAGRWAVDVRDDGDGLAVFIEFSEGGRALAGRGFMTGRTPPAGTNFWHGCGDGTPPAAMALLDRRAVAARVVGGTERHPMQVVEGVPALAGAPLAVAVLPMGCEVEGYEVATRDQDGALRWSSPTPVSRWREPPGR